ncbi:DUF4190 domain-containing protein [Gordonia soli]|uniref:DUF4190 domain-containing protein n=1 Tax=Gordonia soli NBRC 108243 TaxID=1223545 RepID=M0QDS7_9ACTN|nr:DUF4190 domain-containing protein [Gordonia soli]GAC66753.1 hypothetical protein GS4_04_00100 [Gordonia soli NBRC 108243]
MGAPPATTAIPRGNVAAPVDLDDDRTVGADEHDDFGPSDSPRAYSAVDDDSIHLDRPDRPDRPSDPEVPVAARPRKATLNRNAIWALVLSVLGITSPIGVFLGHQARTQIRRTREFGAPFATAALWIGYAWIAFVVLGLIAYFWITAQGS